jgi:hypothetical protein
MPTSSVIPLPELRTMLEESPLSDDSLFVRYLPVLRWLIGAAHPRCVVQLGEDDGLLLMASQMMNGPVLRGEFARSNVLLARIAGPASLGSKPALRSEILLAQASQEVRARSVDLLLLDLGAERIVPALERGLERVLSPQAIVLAYGLADHPEATAALDGFVGDRPAMRMAQGDGLLIVLHGPDQPELLASLFAALDDSPLRADLLATFARIGALLDAERRSKAAGRRLDAERLAHSEALARRDSAQAELRAELEARHKECSELQADAVRRDRELEELTRWLEEQGAGESAVAFAELAVMKRQLARLRRERRRMLASTSWKLTAPIRKVAGLVRRLR